MLNKSLIIFCAATALPVMTAGCSSHVDVIALKATGDFQACYEAAHNQAEAADSRTVNKSVSYCQAAQCAEGMGNRQLAITEYKSVIMYSGRDEQAISRLAALEAGKPLLRQATLQAGAQETEDYAAGIRLALMPKWKPTRLRKQWPWV